MVNRLHRTKSICTLSLNVCEYSSALFAHKVCRAQKDQRNEKKEEHVSNVNGKKSFIFAKQRERASRREKERR